MPSTSPGFTGLGSTGNPYIRLPDGRRMLWSDINDASLAMDLGGVNRGGTRGGPSIQVTPNATPRPSRGLVGDNSGVGFVNPRPLRQDNQANTDWWQVPRDNPNRPHQAMDFDPNPSASGGAAARSRTEIGAGVQGESGYNPVSSEIFDVSGLHNYGEPSVQFPNNDPQLVADAGWWRETAGELASSNSGGSIWEGSGTIGDFGGDLTLGSDSNASLRSLRFGEGYGGGLSYRDTPLETNDLSGLNTYDETTYRPTIDPSDPFTLHTYDENEPQYTNAPPDNDNDLSGLHHYAYPGSGNLSNFGGDLTLGGFLNTSLSSMRYGEGYPVQGGFADTSGGNEPTGDVQIDPLTGAPFDLESIPEVTDVGSTFTPSGWQGNAASNPGSTPQGLTVIGTDTRTGQPIYQDAQGNRFVNPGTGTRISSGVANAVRQGDYTTPYGASAQRTANNMQMYAAQMNPLGMVRAGGWGSGDEIGHNRFYGREHGMWEASDGIAMRVPGVSGGSSRSGVRGLSGG